MHRQLKEAQNGCTRVVFKKLPRRISERRRQAYLCCSQLQAEVFYQAKRDIEEVVVGSDIYSCMLRHKKSNALLQFLLVFHNLLSPTIVGGLFVRDYGSYQIEECRVLEILISSTPFPTSHELYVFSLLKHPH